MVTVAPLDVDLSVSALYVNCTRRKKTSLFGFLLIQPEWTIIFFLRTAPLIYWFTVRPVMLTCERILVSASVEFYEDFILKNHLIYWKEICALRQFDALATVFICIGQACRNNISRQLRESQRGWKLNVFPTYLSAPSPTWRTRRTRMALSI